MAPKDVQWAINPHDDVLALLEAAPGRGASAAAWPSIETFARSATPPTRSSTWPRSNGSDLIVVGNKGMTGAKRFLLGSVPNKVSHHAPCSVLIVRTTLTRCTRPAAGTAYAGAERHARGRRAGVEQPVAVVGLGWTPPSGVAVCSRRARTWSGDGCGPITRLAMTSAAVAETAGAAIEVP